MQKFRFTYRPFRFKRHLNPKFIKHRKDATSKNDIWLLRLAHLSQVGLLALGLFGYFYTVRPVFQTQLLQEEVAQLEIDKTNSEKTLESLFKQETKVRGEIQTLHNKLTLARNDRERLSFEIENLRKNEIVLRNHLKTLNRNLQLTLTELDISRWRIFIQNFSLIATFTSIKTESLAGYETLIDNPKQYFASQKKNWPQPYQILMTTITIYEDKLKQTQNIPESYFNEIRNMIEKRKTNLLCEEPDLDEAYVNFVAEMDELERLLPIRIQKKEAEIIKEYEKPGKRVVLSDEYKEDIKVRELNVGKLEIGVRYTHMLRTSRQECMKLLFNFLNEIEHSKLEPQTE